MVDHILVERLEKKLKEYINLSYLEKFGDEVKLEFLNHFKKKIELHQQRILSLKERGYIDKKVIEQLQSVDKELNRIKKEYNIDYKLLYVTNIIKK